MFEYKLKNLDYKQFPRYYMEVPFSQDKPLPSWPKRIEVNNKIEYLKLMIDNIIRFKQ